MQDNKIELTNLSTDFKKKLLELGIEQNSIKLNKLRASTELPDFWRDHTKSSSTMKEISRIENFIKPWNELRDDIKDLESIISLNDSNLDSDIAKNLSKLKEKFDSLKQDLKFNGPYDKNDVIFSIYAGEGGTDAQDWAAMLLRMYTKFFDSHRYNYEMLSQTTGEEAGIKSVSLLVSGEKTYGYLKSENGVHRLVRLSPFNADHLRQTSFARVEVLPKISNEEDIDLQENELKIDVYRSGGRGGQSVNTTDSAVRVTHLPTGVTVAIQNERSQLQNKNLAIEIIKSKLNKLKQEQRVDQISKLKGENLTAEMGNQIRSYVLHPYKQVKDLRTKAETSDVDGVLNGNISYFIESFIDDNLAK